MSDWEINYTPDFYGDLRNIFHYLSNVLSAPEAARKHVEAIRSAVKSLSDMPYRCPLFDDNDSLRQKGVRKMLIGKYICLYHPNEETHKVDILNVFNGLRNIRKLVS